MKTYKARDADRAAHRPTRPDRGPEARYAADLA
jgi:hypothetical protein